MTYREHLLLSERAYFEELLRGRSVREAIRISGLHKGTFYRRLKMVGLKSPGGPTQNRGNTAWRQLGSCDVARSRRLLDDI
jgi:hypothetical protein